MRELMHRAHLSLGGTKCCSTLVSWERVLALSTGDSLSERRIFQNLAFAGSVRWNTALASLGRGLPQCARHAFPGQKRIVEELWGEFFSDPSQWWDNRMNKDNPRYPDFKHKNTGEGLWINGKSNPPWVETELNAMAPGTLQPSILAWNKRLSRYCKAGKYEKTLELFQEMKLEGMVPDTFTFVAVINACAASGALQQGRHIHNQIIKSGCELHVYVGSCLINMYAKCGSIEDARKLFNKMPTRDVCCWNAIILGYAKCGKGWMALELYSHMQQEKVAANAVTFVGVLNACSSVAALEEGQGIHEQVILSGCESNIFVASGLVDMYAKCGRIQSARQVFDKMSSHDVVAWSAMILGYAKCGEGQKALELFHKMQWEGVKPNHVTFMGVLNACASIAEIDEGRRIHQQVIDCGCESDIFVGSSLVDMYAKCGSLKDAQLVFDKMTAHDVVAWTAMIVGYVKCGEGQKALELWREMEQEGVDPDVVTFVGVLNSCANVKDLAEGMRVHQQIIKSNYESDICVASSLVDMYAKCGHITDAWTIFEKMPTRDVVAWSSIILGYAKCGDGKKALKLFQQMRSTGLEPDTGTFVGVLNACASEAALEEGRHAHTQIIELGYESDIFVGSSLVDMYAKCGSIREAERIFNKMPRGNVVSWSAMLGGYAMHGHFKEALEHFERMCEEGVQLSGVTFVSLLSACSHAGLLNEGLHYFESMSSLYRISATVEHCTCVVDLLGRAGCLHEAEDLIKTMPFEPSSAIWFSLLSACRVHGNVEIGERAAEAVLELDPGSSSSYVLLSNIYAAAD